MKSEEDTLAPMSVERFFYEDPDAPKPNVPLSPGVSSVIFDANQRILFIKRTRGDYWSLPGGRMDIGESAQGCCIRETLEETGLLTHVVRLVAVNTNPHSIVAYPDGNIHQSFVICFEVEVDGGQFEEGPETEGFRWCGPEEIDDLKLIPDSRLNALDAWAKQEAAFIR
ncbi:MAG TPA: NUDIX domain-containing protein [Chthonomonadaceae bacterium]|nr:NUDIX domain-containing protein [Chthonomonadaceae bacterium]